jgi:thiamine-phosphate pyrophosphorylase
MLEAGADFIYLRKIFMPGGIAEMLRKLPAERHHQLIVPASAPEAADFPVKLHVKEAERFGAVAPSAFSTSIHDLASLASLPQSIRLCYYGPVFPSISKPGYLPDQSIETLTKKWDRYRQAFQGSVVALGGITHSNLSLVHRAGFDGAALCGSIWNAGDPVNAFRQIAGRVNHFAG